MKLVLATQNKGKIKEFTALLKPYFSVITTMAEEGIKLSISEDGQTFYDNAYIKAKFVAEKLNCCSLSDDSGLCVEVLDGAPGVFSARYAGENCNDLENNLKLLKQLNPVQNRKAYFYSCIVLYNQLNKRVLYGEGKVFGRILYDFDGNNGFGYDSLFYCDELQKSFGKATDEEKNTISHRRRAVDDLINKLKINSDFFKV